MTNLQNSNEYEIITIKIISKSDSRHLLLAKVAVEKLSSSQLLASLSTLTALIQAEVSPFVSGLSLEISSQIPSGSVKILSILKSSESG